MSLGPDGDVSAADLVNRLSFQVRWAGLGHACVCVCVCTCARERARECWKCKRTVRVLQVG